MAVIDPTTSIGKLRLRVADFSDLPMLQDSVYNSVLADTNSNLNKSSITIASYILGMLSMKVDRRMGLQLEVKGSQAFKAYKEFLLMTISNPAFMDLSPLPFGLVGEALTNPLAQFQKDWNRGFYTGNESQQLAITAEVSPNDGSRLGPYALDLGTWTLT